MRRALLLAAILLATSLPAFATYSVIAVDQKTGQVVFGLATCTIAPPNIPPNPTAVIVPGKGVATCQAGVDLTGRVQMFVFEEIRKGTDPRAILAKLREDPEVERRQFGIVDLQGRSIGFNGSSNAAVAINQQGEIAGQGIFFSVQGNILAGEAVVIEAANAFRRTTGSLADRVMAALEAADANGGDKRCTCDTAPKPAAPCESKTSLVASLIMARSTDVTGKSYNDGEYAMRINVTSASIRPEENANPVKTLRLRYEAWKRANR